MPRSPIPRILITLVCLDVLFTVLLLYNFIMMMGVEGAATGTVVAVFAVGWVAKQVVWLTTTPLRLQALSRWPKRRQDLDPATISEVAKTAYRAPFVFGITWGALFGTFWYACILLVYFGFSDNVPFGPRTLEASALVTSGIALGAMELAFPLSEWLMAPFIESVSLAAQER